MNAGAARPRAVLLGGEMIALSAARSLGAAGVEVVVLGDARWDTVRASRWCARFADVGSGDGVEERWLAWLERERVGGVVIPCSDDGLTLVAHERPRLVELGYAPAEANDEVVLAMLDKARTYELARHAGVETPRTVVVRTDEDAAAAAELLGFPCALKPRHSHRFARHFSVRSKLRVVRDADELRGQLRELTALGLEMLATEIVAGPDDAHSSYYGYLVDGGDSLVSFTKRKVRQHPPHFGLGTYHVTSWEPETAELGLRLFRAIGLRGLACAEFKRDVRDGRLKLIEVNHRLTLANEVVRAAGLDLARLVYARAAGADVPERGRWREGVRLWLPVEDARAFARYRRHGELSVASWAASLAHRQRFPVLKLSDPLPALLNYRRMASSVLRRGRVRGRRVAPAQDA